MKRVIKGIALLLAAVLLFAVCGCTPSESENGGTTESTTTGPSDTEMTDNTPSAADTTTTTDAAVSSTTVSGTTTVPTTKPSVSTKTTATTKTTGSTTTSTTIKSLQITTSSNAGDATTSIQITLPTVPQPDRFDTGTGWKNKKSEVGYGFYSMRDRTLDDPTNEWSRFVYSDYVNTVFVWSAEELAGLREHNVHAWMYVNDIFTMVRNNDPGWQDAFDALWQTFVDSGDVDALLGWYLDEPSDMAAVKKITEYAYKNYHKRFLICFMVQTVAPDVWGGYIDENSHLTREYSQYLTDIAVDMYWDVQGNEQTYEKLFNSLHKVMNPDAKVWYIPKTYTHYEILDLSTYEVWNRGQNCIKHVQFMYEFLKKEPEKNRGGILVFAYDFDSPWEQIYSLYNVNQLMNGAWDFVMDECIRIGQEVCSGRMG